jgi:DNA-directed RNA polymerase subunit RPC12/RpoP
MKLKQIKCPSCGGELEISKDSDEIKCKYCGSKIMIDDKATEVSRIKSAEVKAKKELDEHELENKKKNDEYNDEREYKKKKSSSKLKGWSIAMTVVCLFLAFTTFEDGKILSGLVGMIQFFTFGYVTLLCLDVLPEKIRNLHKIVFIGGCILFIPFISLENVKLDKNKKASNIDLSNVELSDHLPMPENQYGKIDTDRNDLLIFEIYKVDKADFKSYVKKCDDSGYNIDLEYENWDTVYGAFDKNGYSIRIIFDGSDEEYHVTLKAPEKMNEFEWPTSGPGSLIPATKSLYGRVSWNNSEQYIVHVGNMTISDYNDYVKQCELNGFNIDFSKSEKYYKAYNKDGYELELRYLGGNVIEVSIEIDEDKKLGKNISTKEDNIKEENKASIKENNTKEENNSSIDNNGLRPEFIQAMDDYESFMDEYVEFIKKYSNNPSDTSLLRDYANYMSKYSKAMESFDKWDDENLNDAETKYYIDVQARVNKKLLEVQ